MQRVTKIPEKRRDFGFEEVSLEEHRHRVGTLFNSVSNNYDLMNDLMSLGLHRYWKNTFVQRINPKPEMRILDIAAGTGDISIQILERLRKFQNYRGPLHPITACDPSLSMIEQCRNRAIDKGCLNEFSYVVAPAENLPFNPRCFDLIAISFGLRNVSDRPKAIRNFLQSLDFGGRFMCLEFSPEVWRVIEPLYEVYSMKVIPWLGQMITSDGDAYRYLAESIRKFPAPEILAEELEEQGFQNITWRSLSEGIVNIHSAWRT